MRHSEYMSIVDQTEFSVVLNNTRKVTEEQKMMLSNTPLDKKYKDFIFDDLVITGTEIVLRK